MNEDADTSHSYHFTRDMSGRTVWDRVDGDNLPVPLEILVDRASDGRYMFTGIRIGDGTQEITSATLRQIKLSEILAAYFEHFEPTRLILEKLADLSIANRPHGPQHPALQAFARTYQIELARQPRRAMTAAAKAHNISRATANRWAALCRQLGYLPSPSGPREQGDQE